MREMKDSGVAWIGEIPEQWDISTINSLYTLRNQKVSDRDYPPLSVTMKGIVPQLETAAKTDAHDDRKLVKKGDFAINSRSDRRGSCGISDYDGSVSLINTVLTPRGEMHPVYYNWLFHSSSFADEFYRWGHGIVDDLWTTRWQEMRNITIPVPEYAVQQKIAAHLDRKCTQIDALISNAQQQIEKLKAYKQSVITETVTKGLDPDVTMKDSGVEWIGEIPEHWGTPQIKHIATISSGSTPNRNNTEYWNGSIKWLKTGELQNNEITDSEEHITQKALEETSVTLFPVNTVLMAMYGQGKTRGMTALLKTPSTTNQACAGMTIVSQNILVKYFWKCLMGAYNGIREIAQGSGQPNLNAGLISSFKIPLPPKEEQQPIIDFLDKKCSQIDKLIALKQQKIEKLQQYKKSLIYEYVTGKKGVE